MKNSFRKIGEMASTAELTLKKMSMMVEILGEDSMPENTRIEFEVAKRHLSFLRTFDQNAGSDTLHPRILDKLSELKNLENPSNVDKEYIDLLQTISSKFQKTLDVFEKASVYDTQTFQDNLVQKFRHSFKTSIGSKNKAELDAYNEMIDQTIGLFSELDYEDTSSAIYNIKEGLDALIEARDSDNLNPGGLGAIDGLTYVIECIDNLYKEHTLVPANSVN